MPYITTINIRIVSPEPLTSVLDPTETYADELYSPACVQFSQVHEEIDAAQYSSELEDLGIDTSTLNTNDSSLT